MKAFWNLSVDITFVADNETLSRSTIRKQRGLGVTFISIMQMELDF